MSLVNNVIPRLKFLIKKIIRNNLIWNGNKVLKLEILIQGSKIYDLQGAYFRAYNNFIIFRTIYFQIICCLEY